MSKAAQFYYEIKIDKRAILLHSQIMTHHTQGMAGEKRKATSTFCHDVCQFPLRETQQLQNPLL